MPHHSSIHFNTQNPNIIKHGWYRKCFHPYKAINNDPKCPYALVNEKGIVKCIISKGCVLFENKKNIQKKK